MMLVYISLIELRVNDCALMLLYLDIDLFNCQVLGCELFWDDVGRYVFDAVVDSSN